MLIIIKTEVGEYRFTANGLCIRANFQNNVYLSYSPISMCNLSIKLLANKAWSFFELLVIGKSLWILIYRIHNGALNVLAKSCLSYTAQGYQSKSIIIYSQIFREFHCFHNNFFLPGTSSLIFTYVRHQNNLVVILCWII